MVMGEMDKVRKEYTNGEITVIWRPHLCDHSAVCLMQLPKVFDNSKRPWINMQAAPTASIIDTVNACPTAALTFKYNEEIQKEKEDAATVNVNTNQVVLVENGPIRLSGDFVVMDESGKIISTEKKLSLCRCGKSAKMPFCDGSHRQ
jgi:uncharacterized Fe-S cluster protein YjdI